MVKKTAKIRLRQFLVLVAAALAALSGAATFSAAADAPDWTWITGQKIDPTTAGGHTATLLQDDKVLVAGGFIPDPYGNPLLPISATTLWTIERVTPGPTLNQARGAHTATRLTDGRTLVVGGLGGAISQLIPLTVELGSLNSCELTEKEPKNWVDAAELPEHRRLLHTATLLRNGKVLVAGGADVSTKVHVVDEFPFIVIDNITMSLVPQNFLYTPDETGGSWTAAGSLEQGRIMHTATLLSDDPSSPYYRQVLVVGGLDAYPYKNAEGFWKIQAVPLSSCELYDPDTGWKSVKPLKHPRGGHTATLLPNGKIMVAGGETKDSPFPPAPFSLELARSYEIYDPKNPEAGWICPTDDHPNDPSKRLQVPCALHTATLLTAGPNANKVLVAGGGDTYCEIYDPAQDSWRLTTDLNYPRSWHTATPLATEANAGKLLAVGGGPSLGEIYQPETPPELLPPGVFPPSRKLAPRH